MAMTFLSLTPATLYRNWETLKKRRETRDQMIGSKIDDQKEIRILDRTLR